MAWARRRRPEAEKSADPAKARATGLEYLAAREHSAAELYDRPCRRDTEAAAAHAIADLVEQGWLDDTRYALMRAQSLLYARKSRRAAAHVLRGKGLTNQQVQQALEEVYAAPEEGEDPELAAAIALVQGRYRAKLAAGRRDLVAAALLRRGFGYPVVRRALAEVEQTADL